MSNTESGAGLRTVDGVAVPEPGKYTLDPAHTEIGFVARHLMVAKVRGRFTSFTGGVTIAEDPTQSQLEVDVDAASIETREEQRDAHLRSPDFFDVEKYPKITYKSTNVSHLKGNRWTVAGELTIRGVVRPVALEVTFEGAARDPFGNAKIGFSAEGEIDRDEFGLSYNLALEGGGWLVGKTIKLEIEAELIRQV